jgi:hypothetical protein
VRPGAGGCAQMRPGASPVRRGAPGAARVRRGCGVRRPRPTCGSPTREVGVPRKREPGNGAGPFLAAAQLLPKGGGGCESSPPTWRRQREPDEMPSSSVHPLQLVRSLRVRPEKGPAPFPSQPLRSRDRAGISRFPLTISAQSRNTHGDMAETATPLRHDFARHLTAPAAPVRTRTRRT